MNKTALLVLLLISSLTALFSPLISAKPTLIGERIEIQSQVLQQKRAIQVLLPEGYYSNPGATYPVIYLLDGDYNFHGVSGMLDLLSNKGQLIPDVILVGIADKGTQSYRQYMTPEGLAEKPQEDNGKASVFLKFLSEDVKPYLQKHYRIADNAMLMGQSMGGLFVLNAMVKAPESFNHYVAVSPSVWLHDHAFTQQAKEVLGKTKHQSVSLYLSLADETQMGQYGFINLLDKAQPDNIHWQFKHYPDENHNSVGIIALRNSLKDLYKGWYLNEQKLAKMLKASNDPAGVIIDHYSTYLSQHKMNQGIPAGSVQALIRHYYRAQKEKEFPQVLSRIKKSLPASEQAFLLMYAAYVDHFDSADAALTLLKNQESRFSNSIDYMKAIAAKYEKLEDKSKAHQHYQKAQKLAREQKANQWQINILAAKLLDTQ